jgi:hypothetical protein
MGPVGSLTSLSARVQGIGFEPVEFGLPFDTTSLEWSRRFRFSDKKKLVAFQRKRRLLRRA